MFKDGPHNVSRFLKDTLGSYYPSETAVFSHLNVLNVFADLAKDAVWERRKSVNLAIGLGGLILLSCYPIIITQNLR